MAYSEKQKQYTMKYMKENLDEIKFRLPKGQKAFLRSYAQSRGEKLTPFIVQSIQLMIFMLEGKNGKDVRRIMYILNHYLNDPEAAERWNDIVHGKGAPSGSLAQSMLESRIFYDAMYHKYQQELAEQGAENPEEASPEYPEYH